MSFWKRHGNLLHFNITNIHSHTDRNNHIGERVTETERNKERQRQSERRKRLRM